VARDSAYEPRATVRPRSVDHGSVSAAGSEINRPSGPAAAVILAAGLASFALGLLSVFTAASATISDALILSARVGDLSGVTTAAATVFFVSWAVFGIAWRHADPPLLRVAAAAAVLIALGLLGTFPPVFNLIGG
jgi:hypothetical protein